MINLPAALSLLGQSSTLPSANAPRHDDIPYLLSVSTVNELNDTFISAAELESAGPAVMAWAIIMSNLRETAMSTRESRETRQSIRAADKYGDVDSFDMDNAERSSARGRSSLRRRSSTGSDTSQQSMVLEEIYDTVSIVAVDGDPVLFLASNATKNGRFFHVITAITEEYCTPFGSEHCGMPGQIMRGLLLDLIRASLDFVEYQSPLLTATIAILTGTERFWEAFDRPSDYNRVDPAAIFLQDAYLKQKLLLVAMIQFPHLSAPFLQLCRALALANDGAQKRPAIWEILQDVDTFTCALPSKDFQAYMPTRTQEEADFIELTEPLLIPLDSESKTTHRSISISSSLAKINGSPSVHEIPKGSTGRLMNDSKPFVVAWNQDYSVLKYAGQVLHCASAMPDLKSSSNRFISIDTVSTMIGLITNMMSAAAKVEPSSLPSMATSNTPSQILGMASEDIGRNQDVVSIILDIFEAHLFKDYNPSEDSESLELLVQCVQFMFVLLKVSPNRVWPFLGRSGLLGIGQDDDRLRSIVATQEMTSGRYDFLLGCIRLFESLLEDYVTHLVARQVPSKAIARFGSLDSLAAGISQATMEKVLLALTRTMIEVYETSYKWNFVVSEYRNEIYFRLCSIFHKQLDVCYSLNDRVKLPQKLTRALAPSVQYIIDVFLSRSSNDGTVLPILQILLEGTAIKRTTLPTRGIEYSWAQVVAVTNLTTMMIKINGMLKYPTSHIESQMFRAAPLLAKVYAAHYNFRIPIISLLDTLVCSAASGTSQPSSLLGHMGKNTSSHFLDVLSKVDQPFEDRGLSTAIWSFLSSIVSKRQQWFAIFVLTGETPRQTFKNTSQHSITKSQLGKPLLDTALDALSNIDKLEPRKALDMLEFVALAADFWPWVLGTIGKHSHFLKRISEFAAHIGQIADKLEKPYRSQDKNSLDYNSIQMASFIADILSMYTHYVQDTGNEKFAKMLIPHLSYLIKNAVSVPTYNTSLHRNLQYNFEIKFPGCNLEDFKRTALNESHLGTS